MLVDLEELVECGAITMAKASGEDSCLEIGWQQAATGAVLLKPHPSLLHSITIIKVTELANHKAPEHSI